MQAAAEALRETLWGKLEAIYKSFPQNEGGEISTSRVQQFVIDVLHEESRSEIDYVVKNMFRLDVDGNGTVSFIELGNFLFKRHCGEMSLQRTHKMNKMSRGSERLMTLAEFLYLLNLAYDFLKVVCPPDVAEYIFKRTDTDEDGLITYVQYFQIIDIYVCKKPNYNLSKSDEKVKVEPPVPEGPERFSRLRQYIWDNLRKLYDAHVQGRTLQANDVELRALLFSIVGELSQSELAFLSAGLLKLNYKVIEFEAFVINFILLIAELGLSRYSSNNSSKKKTLNKDEFCVLLKNSFSFLRLGQFKNSFLYKIFAKIDKNNDGLITYDEYLDWVRRFLAVLHYFGDEFWVEDDDVNSKEDLFDRPPEPVKSKTIITFKFSDYEFAIAVRKQIFKLLVPYDVDEFRNEFSKAEIEAAMVGIFEETPIELIYVTSNMHRYDRDDDKSVTYDEMTNFCAEMHLGEIAIQRLHKKNKEEHHFSRGSERVMNEVEFGKTLNYGLRFIQMEAPQGLISLLFSEIDLDHDGWISYETYFTFMKYYFGSLSLSRISTLKLSKETKVTGLSPEQKLIESLQGLSPLDRFVRLITDQLMKIFSNFDYNKNGVFELDEIEGILEKVFELQESEVQYILFNFFNFDQRANKSVSFKELIAIILSIYFIELLFKKKYHSSDSSLWVSSKINQEEFISLITDACFFLKVLPLRDDLIVIFQDLDTDKDGFITFLEFAAFIKKYLGNNIDFVKIKPAAAADSNGISEEELNFVGAIWDELKVYFDKYDAGKKSYLNQVELKAFVVEVLNESSERELNYIFWNLFRVDSNSNKEVDFLEFAPFILNHAGEISLQRFHRNQTKGKNTLTEEELFIVINNAYKFLTKIPKEKGAVNKIFVRIQKDGSVNYATFLNWVHLALAAKYKK